MSFKITASSKFSRQHPVPRKRKQGAESSYESKDYMKSSAAGVHPPRASSVKSHTGGAFIRQTSSGQEDFY